MLLFNEFNILFTFICYLLNLHRLHGRKKKEAEAAAAAAVGAETTKEAEEDGSSEDEDWTDEEEKESSYADEWSEADSLAKDRLEAVHVADERNEDDNVGAQNTDPFAHEFPEDVHVPFVDEWPEVDHYIPEVDEDLAMPIGGLRKRKRQAAPKKKATPPKKKPAKKNAAAVAPVAPTVPPLHDVWATSLAPWAAPRELAGKSPAQQG